MATITVRGSPRSSRRALEVRADGAVLIRVRAAPEGGRATEEARGILAEALSVPPSALRLRTGVRSRAKTFEIEGLSDDDLEARLRRA